MHCNMMEYFTAEVRTMAATADDAGRRKILDSVRELQYSLETPHDTLNRVIYYVSMPLVLPVAYVEDDSIHKRSEPPPRDY
jgi:demethylsterigmatocystin 6-O-methyltransferase